MHGVLGTVQRIRQRLRGNGSWLLRWPTEFWGQKGWRSGVGILLGLVVTLWLVSQGVVMAMVGLVGWMSTWVWRWRQRWDTVRKQLERRQGEIVSLQRHIADHEHQWQTDQTQIQDLRTTLAQLEQQLGENQTAYEAQILEQAHKIDQLNLTLQEQRNDTAYSKLLEENNEDLQAQLHQLKRQDEDYTQALQALKNQTDALQAEKAALTDQLRAVSHKLQMCQWQQDHSQGIGEGTIDPHLRTQMPYRLVITKSCQKDLAHQGNGKDYRQLVERIFLLQENPRPQDSRPLNRYGLRGVFSVDAGEYRIAYRVEDSPVGGGEVELIMVDKRNDDCIYDRLRRTLPQHF